MCNQACNSTCFLAWLEAFARGFGSDLALMDLQIELLLVAPFAAPPPTLVGRDNRFLTGVFACTSLAFGWHVDKDARSVGWELTSSKASSESFDFCLHDPKDVEGIFGDRPNEAQVTSEYDFLWFMPFFLLEPLERALET